MLTTWPTRGGLGVQLWNVSNPSGPQLIATVLADQWTHGVALWRSGSSYYMAIRLLSGSRIYDLTCLATSSCSTLASPLWSADLGSVSQLMFMTHSRSNGEDFLYVTNPTRTSIGVQDEWLYRVTNPSAPVDITPPAVLVEGELTGYWGWYYRRNPTGFNWIRSMMGKFHGKHFFRAAYGIFDVHEYIPPAAPPDGGSGTGVDAGSGAADGAVGTGPDADSHVVGGALGDGDLHAADGNSGLVGGCGCRIASTNPDGHNTNTLVALLAAGALLCRRRPKPPKAERRSARALGSARTGESG
jgi:MYXO-CTERM domain-containing protein